MLRALTRALPQKIALTLVVSVMAIFRGSLVTPKAAQIEKLLVSQRDDRVDAHGATGGDPAGTQGYENQQCSSGQKASRIEHPNSVEQRVHASRKQDREAQADGDSGNDHGHSIRQN